MNVRPSMERDSWTLGRACSFWQQRSAARQEGNGEKADSLRARAQAEVSKLTQERMSALIEVANDRAEQNRLGRGLRAAMRAGIVEVGGTLPTTIRVFGPGSDDMVKFDLHPVTTGVKKTISSSTPPASEETKAA